MLMCAPTTLQEVLKVLIAHGWVVDGGAEAGQSTPLHFEVFEDSIDIGDTQTAPVADLWEVVAMLDRRVEAGAKAIIRLDWPGTRRSPDALSLPEAQRGGNGDSPCDADAEATQADEGFALWLWRIPSAESNHFRMTFDGSCPRLAGSRLTDYSAILSKTAVPLEQAGRYVLDLTCNDDAR
jgi:hypothetical protein